MHIKSVEFKQIYNDMLTQFPPEELKPYERFCEILGRNYKAYEFWEDEPVGYAVIFEDKNYILVDYLAVYKNFHSKGYGGKILDILAEQSGRVCFFELEKPDKTKINTLRRIKFYEAHGAKKADIDYFYPAYDKPLSMDLYYIGSFCPQKNEVLGFVKNFFQVIHSDSPTVDSAFNLISKG